MTRPTLVVVSGPPGSGKTTLAHELAGVLGCPAICRDEIKQGMVRATPGFIPAQGDELTLRTLTVFFGVLDLLVRAGVTLIAEAAFQNHVWRPRLMPFAGLTEIRVIRCTTDPADCHARIANRADVDPHRAAHDDGRTLRDLAAGTYSVANFVPISSFVPALDVDTTDGYHPAIPEIVAFIEQ